MSGDTTVDSGTAKITFVDNIGNTAPASLTVTTTGDIEFNSTVAIDGDVTLGSDIGDVPEVAKIYKDAGADGNLTITTNGGNFVMGRRQKLTLVDGDLLIDTSNGNGGFGNVSLADLSVNGSIEVLANTITLLAREAGEVLLPDGINRSQDRGMDVVANGPITFTAGGGMSVNGVAPDDILIASTNAGVVNVPAVPGTRVLQFAGDFPGLVTQGGQVLDVRAEGIGREDVAEGLAGATPKAESEVPQEALMSPALREFLGRLGIFPRDLTQEEQALYGRNIPVVYRDMQVKEGIRPEEREVPVSRLPGALVTAVFNIHQEIFGEAGGRTSHIRSVLKKALTAYTKALTATHRQVERFDPPAFRRYLESPQGQKDALAIINELRRLFTQVELLGLPPAVETNAELILVTDIVKSLGISPEALVDVVNSVASGHGQGK